MLPMVKNKIVECSAIGLYSNLALSICFSVTSATACFAAISFESCLEELKICTAVSSSKMLPSEVDKTYKILSSISFKALRQKLNVNNVCTDYNLKEYVTPFVFGSLNDKGILLGFQIGSFFRHRNT